MCRFRIGLRYHLICVMCRCFVCFFPVSADPMLRSLLAFWKIPIQGDSPGEPRLGAQ